MKTVAWICVLFGIGVAVVVGKSTGSADSIPCNGDEECLGLLMEAVKTDSDEVRGNAAANTERGQGKAGAKAGAKTGEEHGAKLGQVEPIDCTSDDDCSDMDCPDDKPAGTCQGQRCHCHPDVAAKKALKSATLSDKANKRQGKAGAHVNKGQAGDKADKTQEKAGAHVNKGQGQAGDKADKTQGKAGAHVNKGQGQAGDKADKTQEKAGAHVNKGRGQAGDKADKTQGQAGSHVNNGQGQAGGKADKVQANKGIRKEDASEISTSVEADMTMA